MTGFRCLSALLLVPLFAACQPGASATPTAPPTVAPSPSLTRAPTFTAAPEQTPPPEGAVFRVGGLAGDVGVDFAPDGSLLLVAQAPAGITAYDTAASFEQVWSNPLENAISVAASPDGSMAAAIGF